MTSFERPSLEPFPTEQWASDFSKKMLEPPPDCMPSPNQLWHCLISSHYSSQTQARLCNTWFQQCICTQSSQACKRTYQKPHSEISPFVRLAPEVAPEKLQASSHLIMFMRPRAQLVSASPSNSKTENVHSHCADDCGEVCRVSWRNLRLSLWNGRCSSYDSCSQTNDESPLFHFIAGQQTQCCQIHTKITFKTNHVCLG